MKVKDLTGQVLGRLLIIGPWDKDPQGRWRWMCKCVCGQYAVVRSWNLVKPKQPTRSCGCWKRDQTIKRETTHGMSKTPTYKSWSDMMTRCYNKADYHYVWYGSRGISVCPQWHKFEGFFKDMGLKPKQLSLDRINNDGNYEPSNCRWATHKQQCNNRRPKNAMSKMWK